MNSALVDADRLRIAVLPAHPFERGDDVLAAIAEAGIDGGREPRPGVDDGENTQLPARRQLIVHEVRRPGLVASRRLGSIVPELRLHAPLRCLVAELKP